MTIDELQKIEALIAGKSAQPPERIYGWLDTQLSLARLYGAINYQGHRYVLDMSAPNLESIPLVRADVVKREAQEALATMKNEAAAYAARQEVLF